MHIYSFVFHGRNKFDHIHTAEVPDWYMEPHSHAQMHLQWFNTPLGKGLVVVVGTNFVHLRISFNRDHL